MTRYRGPRGGPAARIGGVLRAATPAILAAAAVGGSLAIRVTTPVDIQLLATAVTFTVSGDRVIPLLSNGTLFSGLVIDRCGEVTLPPARIVVDGSPATEERASVALRCDRRIPGARVALRAAEGPAQILGVIGRVVATDGDRVGLEIARAVPPAIRVEMARRLGFTVSIRPDVPFDVVSEFATTAGAAATADAAALGTGEGVATYRAVLSREGRRQVTVDTGAQLGITIEPAADASLAALMRREVSVPIASVSLARPSDPDDAVASTVLEGTLTYPGTAIAPLTIRAGESIRLHADAGLRLTGLGIDAAKSGLTLTLQGDASEAMLGAEDRRMRLFDRLVSDRTRSVLGVIAVLATQLLWLRDRWRPASSRRKERS